MLTKRPSQCRWEKERTNEENEDVAPPHLAEHARPEAKPRERDARLGVTRSRYERLRGIHSSGAARQQFDPIRDISGRVERRRRRRIASARGVRTRTRRRLIRAVRPPDPRRRLIRARVAAVVVE